MSWWEKPQTETAAEQTTPARRPGPSLYEARYADRRLEERWEPVGELDERTGEWVSIEERWAQRVRGWQPLADFLEQRR